MEENKRDVFLDIVYKSVQAFEKMWIIKWYIFAFLGHPVN